MLIGLIDSDLVRDSGGEKRGNEGKRGETREFMQARSKPRVRRKRRSVITTTECDLASQARHQMGALVLMFAVANCGPATGGGRGDGEKKDCFDLV